MGWRPFQRSFGASLWISPASFALLIGLILLPFSWVPGPPFRLEQFDLPKDLVFGALGIVCALHMVLRGRVPWDTAIDAPLAAGLCWGALLTLSVATNVDVAWRALGSLAAALSLFLLARRVGGESGADVVYRAICVALSVVAALVLLETYGGMPVISAPGRGPGATLGNRNLAARLLCLSLPLLWRQVFATDRAAIQRLLMGMVTITTAAVVLSRSRGAWIVAAALLIGLPATSWLLCQHSRSVEGMQRMRTTTRRWTVAILIGGMFAILLPNRLSWSPADFASSASRILDYRTGTGRGRVIQAQTTWRMIRATPLLGVGPGNWSIVYPAFAPADDPSVKVSAFYPAPQVPRNDVLSFTAEFGLPGLTLALASVIALLARALAMARSFEMVTQQAGLMLIALAVAAAILGLFDSVVRVAPTVAVLALTMGLAMGEGAPSTVRPRADRPGSHVARRALLVGYACASLLFARGALRDLAALRIVSSAKTVEDLYRAVAVAPSNVEARMLLAYVLVRLDRCDMAQSHLRRAAQLQPFSGAASRLGAQCARRMRGP